jgi:hypothetical protein
VTWSLTREIFLCDLRTSFQPSVFRTTQAGTGMEMPSQKRSGDSR